jgi:DNA-binding protein H-NS
MENVNLESMAMDDLWALHEQISSILSARIIAEKQQLENRLLWLERGKGEAGSIVHNSELKKENLKRPRRKYPRVFPKYQNPAAASETWSGRGKRPRWLVSALKSGGRIEDFEILGATRDKIRARR